MILLLINNPETNVAKKVGDVWIQIPFNLVEMEAFLESMTNTYNSANYTIDDLSEVDTLLIQGPFVSNTLGAYELNISADSTIKPTVGLRAYIEQLISN